MKRELFQREPVAHLNPREAALWTAWAGQALVALFSNPKYIAPAPNLLSGKPEPLAPLAGEAGTLAAQAADTLIFEYRKRQSEPPSAFEAALVGAPLGECSADYLFKRLGIPCGTQLECVRAAKAVRWELQHSASLREVLSVHRTRAGIVYNIKQRIGKGGA